MSFLSGSDRQQTHLLPPALEDYIGADNPVRFLDASVAKLDLLARCLSESVYKIRKQQSAYPKIANLDRP